MDLETDTNNYENSKVPESLQNAHQSTNRRNNNKAAGSFQGSNKPLNEDIPADKKPKKAKSKKPHKHNPSMRYGHMFEGIAPSI